MYIVKGSREMFFLLRMDVHPVLCAMCSGVSCVLGRRRNGKKSFTESYNCVCLWIVFVSLQDIRIDLRLYFYTFANSFVILQFFASFLRPLTSCEEWKRFHDDETLTDRRNLIISIARFLIFFHVLLLASTVSASNFIFHFESIPKTGSSFVKLHLRNRRARRRGRKNGKH